MKVVKTYKEPRWLALRHRVLVRDKYIDQYWSRYGRFISADMVHHIFPVKDFPEYCWEEWNLISVNRKTHELLHDRENDELTDMGKEILIRTARRNNIDVPAWVLKEKRKDNRRYFYGKGAMGSKN